MVPAPSCPDRWDYWQSSPSDEVELTCLLPNSVYIAMSAKWDDTLLEVKRELWNQAINYPMFNVLEDLSGYVFQFVNSLAVLEVVDDESKRIRDIKPVLGVLVAVETVAVERPGEQSLNTQISHLIGKGLNEFDSLRSSEVKDFRLRMRDLAEDNMVKRAKSDPIEKLRYRYKPRLADKDKTPITLQSHLSNNCFIVLTMFANSDFTFNSSVPATRKPQEHIEIVLRKFANSCNLLGHSYNYVLKVCGREEYLFGDNPLIQFLYIQEMLSTDGVPQVMIVSIDKLPHILNRDITFYGSSVPERSRLMSEHSNTMRHRRNESSWNIDKDYTVVVRSVSRLNVEPGNASEVVCQVGIFYGGKSLCECQKTRVATMSPQGIVQWDQTLTFPIKVYNIPRMARLCFGIYEITTKVKTKWRGKDANKEAINKLAWANTQIFDYKDQMRTDACTLSMWTHVADDTQGDDLLLHPLGTVVDNPSTDSCAELVVRFSNYDCRYPIMFPKREEVIAYSENVERQSPEVMERLSRDFERLRVTAEKDPMYEMHEQEKKDIWAAREQFLEEAPELLPKLLSCVEWGERAEVSSVLRMLPRWKPFERVESALKLLDYAYADAGVRSFAVKCLESISDDDLLLYLLQLVQALKHESYLMCDLAKFLLSRAFNNMTIGHYLFWHMRSEMQVSNVSIRFGLLLEAYCRGSQDHITLLMKQINCLEKLIWLSEQVRKKKDITRAREALKSHLEEQHCVEALRDFFSPLNPSFHCKQIKPDECRVMDSKMRPLLLDFENVDPNGKDIRIIMKNGDDLRQDMFTLQMLRIMDRLWKSEGCDFRLNPYMCISMANSVGMIEVIEEAETVANIQKQNAPFTAASTINKGALWQWLKNKNPAESFNKVAHEFRMSCAGYCVATYVLGIADRHPDNIMVKKSGQLFHIDFGHFLGHFKHKFGFKREFQPFVLTHDFIRVINKGQKSFGKNESMDFKIFKEYCEKAFKILRNHGHLILSLFSMMISTGLPELSSEKDLQFLRETLVMDLSEDKAMEHFRRKFNEALKNAPLTSVHWTFHNMDKNN